MYCKYTLSVMVRENSLLFPQVFPFSVFSTCPSVTLIVFVCVGWPGCASTLLSAISSSHPPVCSPASHQFISLQYIDPCSSFTHCQTVESTSVIAYAPGFVSRYFQVGCVINCCFSPQYTWTTTHLHLCLPALQPTTASFLLPALALLPDSSQPSSSLPRPASSLHCPCPFPT